MFGSAMSMDRDSLSHDAAELNMMGRMLKKKLDAKVAEFQRKDAALAEIAATQAAENVVAPQAKSSSVSSAEDVLLQPMFQDPLPSETQETTDVAHPKTAKQIAKEAEYAADIERRAYLRGIKRKTADEIKEYKRLSGRINNRKYQADRKADILEKRKTRRQNDPVFREAARERDRAYYKKNREAEKDRSRTYYKKISANPVFIKANRKRVRAYYKKISANPELKKARKRD